MKLQLNDQYYFLATFLLCILYLFLVSMNFQMFLTFIFHLSFIFFHKKKLKQNSNLYGLKNQTNVLNGKLHVFQILIYN